MQWFFLKRQYEQLKSVYTVKVIIALGLAQLQMHISQLLISTPTDVYVAVTSSRIDKSSWNMHKIKAEWFLFHIMYVTQLFFRTYDSFC